MGSTSWSSVETQFRHSKRGRADASLQVRPLVPTRPGLDGYYDMRFSTIKSITRYLDIDFGELGRYVDKYDGQLFFTSNETEEEEYIGRLTAFKLHRGQLLRDGAGFEKVLEGVNDELHDLTCLFCSTGELKPDWANASPYLINDSMDILLVTAIEVGKYSHRGFGLGLAMLDLAHSQLGGASSLLLLKPFPAQYKGAHLDQQHAALLNSPLGLDRAGCARRHIDAATTKLRSYFQLVGLLPLSCSGYLMRSSDAPYPSINFVCPHLFARINCGHA